MATQENTPKLRVESPSDWRFLPAPHDKIRFMVTGETGNRCAVSYAGSVEDLIAADIVAREALISKRSGKIPERGTFMRRGKAGGRVRVSFLKYEV